MLTRRSTRWIAAVSALSVALLVPGHARADDPPGAEADVNKCGLWMCLDATAPGKQPAQQSGKASGGGKSKSKWTCTYELADPQPEAGSLDWQGHEPGDGAVYAKNCVFDDNTDLIMVTRVWAADPPEAAVDPAVLAQQAVDKMLLSGPAIASPRAAGTYVVGVPVWMWVTPGPTTYGPNTASASAGGVTVTATAQVEEIAWAMGDGKTVTCTSPGTPYDASQGKKLSPDCGHVYRKSSKGQGGGRYRVTATSTWTVDWQVAGGGGQGGQLTETRVSETDIAIGQLKVLN